MIFDSVTNSNLDHSPEEAGSARVPSERQEEHTIDS